MLFYIVSRVCIIVCCLADLGAPAPEEGLKMDNVSRRIESLRDEATCRKEGFKFRWDVNTVSLQKPAVAAAFGLTDAEARSLVDACLALEK